MFSLTLSVAKSGSGDMNRWKDVSYAVFDAPKLKTTGGAPMPYEERKDWIAAELASKPNSYAFAVGSIVCKGTVLYGNARCLYCTMDSVTKKTLDPRVFVVLYGNA
jgi:hypothetical protein